MVQVEPAAHERSRLHLGGGLLLEVRDDPENVVDIASSGRPPAHIWTPPYPDEPFDDDHATVRWAAEGPVVTLVPYDPTTDPWMPRTDDDQMQLQAWVAAEGLERFVDVLSAFQRVCNGADGEGVLLWRGRVTAAGHAVLERAHFGAPRTKGGSVDSRDHDVALAVVATVDLGLARPPARAATAVTAIDGSRYCSW